LETAYFNGKGNLAGLDAEMAHLLAQDLDVQLALVHGTRERMTAQVNAGDCDIVISGTVVTPERALAVTFSVPYMAALLGVLNQLYVHRVPLLSVECLSR
jgi:polar amino acid transport system substrate-binding protein